jgi:epoxyqueuosine reductase
MSDLLHEVREFCRNRGADLFGIASADVLNERAPEGRRPKDLLYEAKVSVVIGIRWVDALIDGIPEVRSLYSRFMLAITWKFDILTMDLARFLQERGYSSLPIPNGDPYDLKELVGCISHKHAAAVAGLGEFGLNNLLLTSEYGPRQRFSQVLTEAPLQADHPSILNLCKNMTPKCEMACIRTCPARAIPAADLKDAGAWEKIAREGQRIDKQGCSQYMDTLPRMGRNGYVYRCGLCIERCPVGSRVKRRESIIQGFRPTKLTTI